MDVKLTGRVLVPWLVKSLEQGDVDFRPICGEVVARENPSDLLDSLGETKGKWVVLDGYHFGVECHKAVRKAGSRVMVIDDYMHLAEYHCDVLLNQNLESEAYEYQGDVGKTLLGPRYALLRKEFAVARKAAGERTFPAKAENIVLSLGGGDFLDYLGRMKTMLEISELGGCKLNILAGLMCASTISELLSNSPAELVILSKVENMSDLLLKSDLCISAGGSTCWELCCLGVPFLTMAVTENQHGIVRSLVHAGIALTVSPETLRMMLMDGEKRRISSRAGMVLVDGLGAVRVVQHLIQLGN